MTVVHVIRVIDNYAYRNTAYDLAVCADRDTARLVAEGYLESHVEPDVDEGDDGYEEVGAWEPHGDTLEYLAVSSEHSFEIQEVEVIGAPAS